MAAFSWTSLLVNLAVSYGLKYLWNTVNILQFAVFMSLWQLSYPNNGRRFLGKLKELALMEFLPTDDVINFLSELMGLDDEEGKCEDCDIVMSTRRLDEADESADDNTDEHSDQLTVSSLGSQNLVRNLGIMLVIALIIALLLLLDRLLKLLVKRYSWLQKLYKLIHDKIFYNLFIRYILQSTLKIQIAACAFI